MTFDLDGDHLDEESEIGQRFDVVSRLANIFKDRATAEQIVMVANFVNSGAAPEAGINPGRLSRAADVIRVALGWDDTKDARVKATGAAASVIAAYLADSTVDDQKPEN